MLKRIAVLTLTLIMLLSILPAQADTYTSVLPGEIRGKVTDEQNNPVSNATVKAGKKQTRTGADGTYLLEMVKPGETAVTFSCTNYDDAEKTVTVVSGEEAVCDCVLTKKAGGVSGTVSDAVDPTVKIAGVLVEGGGKQTVTDSRGGYKLEGLPDGDLNIRFSHEVYTATDADVHITAGETAVQDVVMSKKLASNQYRVVLTWGKDPNDLDSHLWGTDRNGRKYHVYFSNKFPNDPDKSLDVDDTTSYGPETTTFIVYPGKEYYFSVYLYSGSGTLSSSGAKVEVYCGDSKLDTLTVPSGSNGMRVWNVFRVTDGVYESENDFTFTNYDRFGNIESSYSF